ncbi:MAG: phage/plasmid primase, P4 family [Spirochaetaceae bacterium]|nr:phage/plasmid primase, P4 family [Spirochaetaceae bacterium]
MKPEFFHSGDARFELTLDAMFQGEESFWDEREVRSREFRYLVSCGEACFETPTVDWNWSTPGQVVKIFFTAGDCEAWFHRFTLYPDERGFRRRRQGGQRENTTVALEDSAARMKRQGPLRDWTERDGEYFEYQPTFKIFMATNHKPKIGGMDEAIWRRLKLIPFEMTIPPEKQDRDLKGKLQKELPGILMWMLEGCLFWMNEGLGHVTAIDDAKREYRGQMSAIEAFLDSECIRDVNGRVKIAELYDRFVTWCEGNNERVISKRAMGMRMDEMNIEKWRDVDTWYRIGWRLKR